MKQFAFFLLMLGASFAGVAQTNPTAQPAANAKIVATEGTVSSVESVLSDGKLQFTKKLVWGNANSAPSTTYLLQIRNSQFNAGKPFAVNLSKEAFDNFFQKSNEEMNQKWPSLVKFAQEKKLSYNEERSWIQLINYLNSLP